MRETSFLTLSDNNQADDIKVFNFTSRYLDALLNIDNPYCKQMLSQIYHRELQLNQLAVMCATDGERRLISIRCQKECVESKLAIYCRMMHNLIRMILCYSKIMSFFTA